MDNSVFFPYSIWHYSTKHRLWIEQARFGLPADAKDYGAWLHTEKRAPVVLLVWRGLIEDGWPSREAAKGFEETHHCSALQGREKRWL